MKVLSIRPIHGPNIYHHKPVLVMKLDLEELTDKMSNELPGFTERFIAALPGIAEHRCSPGCIGGFVQRLHRGTGFAHIIEHIALELSEQAKIPVYYGKSVYAGRAGLYNIATRFQSEAGMRALLESAVEIAQKIVSGDIELNLPEIIANSQREMNRHELGPSTKAIIDAAIKRDIPWRRIGEESLIQLGYGKNLRKIQAGVTDRTSLIAADIVKDKNATKRILSDAGVPTPQSQVISSEAELLETLSLLRAPWVIKPLDGNHGRGVFLNLKNYQEALEAFKVALEYGPDILVEEMAFGRDYRLLLVNYEIVAAAERRPAHLVSDGQSSIDTLIQITNSDPRRGEGHENVLTKIKVDRLVLKYLARQGFTLDTVPEAGHIVWLRETANISTGGTAEDVTDCIHPEVKTMCERIARLMGLDICGIDLIHSDICQPLNKDSGIIEVNAGPGLRMHLAPTEGKPRDVGATIIDMLYPLGCPSRIPILSVTGTNGKTTAARLLAHVIESRGHKNVGLTTSDGIYVSGQLIMKGDTTGPLSARAVLSDPSVEVAVLELARGGLMRGGLAYDWSDVGIITNIRPDHIGQDGIEDIRDLVKIKSLIAERVRQGGSIVLNADDPEASRLMESPRLKKLERKIVYYSLHESHPLIEKQRSIGGTVFFASDGWLIESTGSTKVSIIESHELSFTLNGTADFQISNALAVAAAARAYGLSVEQVAAGLKSFKSDEHNLGRANFYKVRNGYVLLDYGHNTDAIAAIGRMLQKWKGFKTRCVIGLPGDRDISVIEEAARVAANYFDRLLAREDLDLRGRKSMEIPSIIKKVAEQTRSDIEAQICLNTEQAIEKALNEIQDREVIVILYDHLDEALNAIRRFDPQPVSSIPIDEVMTITFFKETASSGITENSVWLQ